MKRVLAILWLIGPVLLTVAATALPRADFDTKKQTGEKPAFASPDVPRLAAPVPDPDDDEEAPRPVKKAAVKAKRSSRVVEAPAPAPGLDAPPVAPAAVSGAGKIDVKSIQAKILHAGSLGPGWQLALANRHIAKSLENLRLEAVSNGDDPDKIAREFLEKEVCDWRFLTWYALARTETLPKLFNDKRVMRWWMHNNTTAAGYHAPVEVPGSEGLLWQINIRDFNWTKASWRAVAAREPFMRYPRLDKKQITLLQRFIGEHPLEIVEDLIVNDKPYPISTCPAIGIIRADWLFRQSIETDLSTVHYDLLYSVKRFPDDGKGHTTYEEEETYTEKVPSTVYQQVYDTYYRTYSYQQVTTYSDVQKTRKVAKHRKRDVRTPVVDFPRDQDDWDEFWGIKASRDFLLKQGFDQTFGAVVAGSRDDPSAGSIVARNNRVTEFLRTPLGVSMRTIDVGKTTRGNDFISRPTSVLNGKVKARAAELITSLASGGFANLLVNGERKRTEIAPTVFAHNKVDSRLVDVRNPIGCVTCHAGDGGVIMPRNLFADYKKSGINLNIDDRVERNRLDSFMLHWEKQVASWRAPYLLLIDKATAEPEVLVPGMKPAELVKSFLDLRDRIDNDMDVAQVAHEFGMPVAALKYLANQVKVARTSAIVRDHKTPRDVFEADVYFLLSDAYGKHGDAVEWFSKRSAR